MTENQRLLMKSEVVQDLKDCILRAWYLYHQGRQWSKSSISQANEPNFV